MKHLILILSLTTILQSCELFKEDETAASGDPTVGTFEALTCDDFNEEVNTAAIEAKYGVDVDCTSGVITAFGEDLSASFTSSCMDTDLTIGPSNFDISINFSGVEYNEEAELLRGTVLLDYDIELGTITNLGDISELSCVVDMGVDAETEIPTLQDFNGFECVITKSDFSTTTISFQDLSDIDDVITYLGDDPDCDDVNAALADISDEAKVKVAIRKARDIIDEFLNGLEEE
jgi:hypothetical protein